MKILIAEDDATSRLVLSATLRKMGHEVVSTANGQQAWDALGEEYFSLLISDWMMPDMDGLDLCRRIRGSNQAQYTYIILLTSMSGKTSYLDGMDAGADDFITKPFDEDQLAARLRVADRILALHEKLRSQARFDGLTGLLNRTSIMDCLVREMERASRESQPLSIVLLDLDNFKQVNDIHGHAAGDTVLREAAERMKSSMRGYDQVGRYGGEEFLIVAPICDEQNSLTLAERVRENICGSRIQTPQGPLAVTCSLGVAVASAAHGESAPALIARADEALYRAKANGRNRVELAENNE